jgi:hypothetical protein
VIKKYCEKRWVTTKAVPDSPPTKVYRSYEALVIQFISTSNPGVLKRQSAEVKARSTVHGNMVRLLKRNVNETAEAPRIGLTEDGILDVRYPALESPKASCMITICDVGVQTD